MNNKGSIYLLYTLSLLTMFVSLFGIYQTNKSKLAYVRSNELLYNYHGMKDAQLEYERRMQMLQSSLNTQSIHNNVLPLDSNLLNSQIELFKQKSAQEDRMLTQGVLNQINQVTREYAENKGYQLVIGTSDDVTILYAENSVDVTQDLLAMLNQKYDGKRISK